MLTGFTEVTFIGDTYYQDEYQLIFKKDNDYIIVEGGNNDIVKQIHEYALVEYDNGKSSVNKTETLRTDNDGQKELILKAASKSEEIKYLRKGNMIIVNQGSAVLNTYTTKLKDYLNTIGININSLDARYYYDNGTGNYYELDTSVGSVGNYCIKQLDTTAQETRRNKNFNII